MTTKVTLTPLASHITLPSDIGHLYLKTRSSCQAFFHSQFLPTILSSNNQRHLDHQLTVGLIPHELSNAYKISESQCYGAPSSLV